MRSLSVFFVFAAFAACGFEQGSLGPDAAPPAVVTVAFDKSTTMTDEAEGMVRVAVLLSGASDEPVTVDYKIDGASTASRPDDYALPDGTLIFSPGQTTRNIDIGIASDTIEEADELITIVLSNPVGAALGMKLDHTVTISSDILPRVSFADPAPSNANEATNPMIELVLTIPPKDPVNVELGVTGTASPTADHGITNGFIVAFPAMTMSRTIPLGVVQDLLDEDDETVNLALQNPSLKLLVANTNNTRSHQIDDDDPMPTVQFMLAMSSTGENTNASLTVSLSAMSGRTVTVPYSVTGGTATAADGSVAAGPLVFDPGQMSKTIAVTVTNDMLDENDETIIVTLGAPNNATLASTNTAHTLTINDNDDPPTVAFTASMASANEVVAAVNLQLTLSTASSFDVTVPFVVNVGSTADNPDDYTMGTTTPVTIPAGMTTANIVVNVKADSIDEANETVIVDLGAPTNATLGTIASTTLTINDDDTAPTVAFTSAGSSPNEGNNNITLTVQLSDISGQDVTIPYTIDAASTASNPSDYTIAPATPITITAGNTSTTIVISMIEDTLAEGDETVIVNLGMPTNATLGAQTTYTLTIKNDDGQPDVSWDPTESNLNELEGTGPGPNATRQITFKMVLTEASGLTITVPILYTGTATRGSDFTGPSSISFPPNALTADVTLTIAKDGNTELDETIIMTIDTTGVTNAGTKNPLIRTYTIENDD